MYTFKIQDHIHKPHSESHRDFTQLPTFQIQFFSSDSNSIWHSLSFLVFKFQFHYSPALSQSNFNLLFIFSYQFGTHFSDLETIPCSWVPFVFFFSEPHSSFRFKFFFCVLFQFQFNSVFYIRSDFFLQVDFSDWYTD